MTTPDTNALLSKLNRYAGAADTDLTDLEIAYLREQLTTRKKYGLIWEDKPEAVEQQLLTGLPVLTEVAERHVQRPTSNVQRPTSNVQRPKK